MHHPTHPVRINLDTTRRCQLTCWYCHSSSGPDYRGPVIGTEMLADIIDTADAMRAFEITVTGGEPALWPGLIPLLELSTRLEYTQLLLITNALTTTPRLLAAIEAAALSRICVSLDGIGEVHDRNRGPGTFARALAGLRRLVAVHGNVTVISVVDATNHDRWPELTGLLAEIGVTAHHLAPVCTAGHALTDYRGLSVNQFAEVHERVRRVHEELPEIEVVFNDQLVRSPASRTMGLHQFTENYKGWHRVVRPDGDIRTLVRAWGRTWRADESQGNLTQGPLRQILATAPAVVPFSRSEEVARKFRIGADSPLIRADHHDIETPDRPGDGPVGTPVPVAEPLGVSLASLAGAITETPGRFLARAENGFTLLFDTGSHRIHILDPDEREFLADAWAGVRS